MVCFPLCAAACSRNSFACGWRMLRRIAHSCTNGSGRALML
jgi:hypothetical protein